MADLMTPITTSKVSTLFVEVPKGAYRLFFYEGSLWTDVRFPKVFRDVLPPGSYTFLFTTKDATEQQAGEVVDDYVYVHENGHTYDMYYRNYMDVTQVISKDYSLDESVKSLRTLMIAHGLDVSKNYAVLKIN